MQSPSADDRQQTRRAWLAALPRWSALAGLCGMTAWLALRPSDSAAAKCPQTSPCRACGERTRCELPPALHFREQQTQTT